VADPHDLKRFVDAQGPVIDRVREELAQGRKRSHWMWFVFPQIAGLGHSMMAQRYAMSGLPEAKAYLAHPLLGVRLREITTALADLDDADAARVFGGIDAMKLRSSLTLFAHADEDHAGLFRKTLDRWFDRAEDPATVERL